MVTQNSSSDDFTRRVGGLVENAKRNTQWRQQFMEWDREMACMRAKGRNEGAQEKAAETATNLIKMRVGTLEQIEQATGVPMEELQRIATATAN